MHKWLAGIGMKRSGQRLSTRADSPAAPMQFLSVGLAANGSDRSSCSQDIRLDLDLGAVQIKLNCAHGGGASVAALLHAVAEMVARA